MSKVTQLEDAEEELMWRLTDMTLDDSEPRFVGGFNPVIPTNGLTSSAARPGARNQTTPLNFPTPVHYASPGPLPTPPRPMYESISQGGSSQRLSRTMQHALSPPDHRRMPPKAQQTPIPSPPSKPIFKQTLPATPPPAPSTPVRSRPLPAHLPASAPPKTSTSRATPESTARSSRARSASSPPSPTLSAPGSPQRRSQCNGFTRAGKRCKNVVAECSPLESLNPGDHMGLERYCHIHKKEVLKDPKFILPSGRGVHRDDWIPNYLHPQTQANILREMQKPLSVADEPGYIYALEYRVPGDRDRVHYKVGRSYSLNQRTNQWDRQCGSKQQYLRGWWPGSIQDGEKTIMKGCVDPGEPGPYCHRLERLIHLELADLVSNEQYLQSQFPDVMPALQAMKPRAKEQCPDCGRVHREIFSFAKAECGPFQDKEWEKVVMPVIEKWGRFVQEYYLAQPDEVVH
ncbi:uncharacterized protein FIBRA_03780 [Fibroporia radiculosa]|uniref:DUF1766-domain-containing protein n=1 Tax=Fibroporia radiculosa TaxID=599839 RepID=J4GNN8_9APHY|nr:uncharacterized protein FIBRA_03780 [Fibroporia radiculosa]CCM01715.1 predicted protein [Fibroporia radiculosa]